jgi:hypothetical protein
VGEGGEMTQALYAHMNKRKKKERLAFCLVDIFVQNLKRRREAEAILFLL